MNDSASESPSESAAPVILSVVGARPNFMKLAPVARALAGRTGVRHVVVHTGQHHDPEMSAAFFRDLHLAPADFALGVGSGSHAHQCGSVMQRLEPVLESVRPGYVLVYGDVNSTVAAALTAVKLGIRVAHVEAGLRSRDRTMPEEINRVLTDQCADVLFAPSEDAAANLRAEGLGERAIHVVGNVMIDSLRWALPAAERAGTVARFGLEGRPYAVATLHRPSNVDDPERLAAFVGALRELGGDVPVVFPVHPRTRRQLERLGARPAHDLAGAGPLYFVEPLSYVSMLALLVGARLAVTDSGGVQEETTYLGVPCLTVRTTTERPITCTHGTNRLVPAGPEALVAAARAVLNSPMPVRPRIPFWDGHTADRIADVLLGSRTAAFASPRPPVHVDTREPVNA